MNKVDIIKKSKIDSGIVEDNLFEDWKIMRQTLEDEERKFKEVSNNKIDALAIYLYVMIPASFVCIVATQSIIYSLLCVFSLVIPFFIFSDGNDFMLTDQFFQRNLIFLLTK